MPSPTPQPPGAPGPATADPPPPPYTETDIFSVSGGSRPARSHRASTSSAASTHTATDDGENNIIYTPPETPVSVSYAPYFSGPPPAADLDNQTVSSAQAYFESRPAPPAAFDLEGEGALQDSLIHSVVVKRESKAEDFPYQEGWRARDVTETDWMTFVNHLIPHHIESAGERKMRTEGGARQEDKGKEVVDGEEEDEDARSATMDFEPEVGTEKVPEWRQNATDAIREWNDGFFAPRGITIFLQLSPAAGGADNSPHVPGAWDTSFDSTAAGEGGRRGRGGWFQGFDPTRSAGRDNENNGPRRGFSFGGITVDGDNHSLSVGNMVHVDRNGVRVGGLHIPAGGPHNHAFSGMRGFGCPPQPPPGFTPWGPFGRGEFGAGRGRGGDECGGRGRGRSRGRHGGGRHRSSSSSSSTSSSSSSSSDSVESVGSLPAYEDLKDSQLPVTKDFLQNWLNHPDQPVTKDSVKALKAQIKAAKNDAKDAGPSSFAPSFDKVALRREVKAMMQEWKNLKKQQRKMARQEKKERRAARRAAKRERRDEKREARKGRREARRQGRRGGRNRDRGEEHAHDHHGHGHGHGSHGGPGSHGRHGPNVAFPWGPPPPGFPAMHDPANPNPMAPNPAMPNPLFPTPPAPGAIPSPPGGFPTGPFGHPLAGGRGPFGGGPRSSGRRGFGSRGCPPGGGGPCGGRGGLFGRGGFFDLLGGSGPSFPPSRGGPPGYSGPPAPGAWPGQDSFADDDDNEEYEARHGTPRPSGPGPHRASSAKYAAAEDLAAKIEEKENELVGLHEDIAREDEEKNGGWGGNEKVLSAKAQKARAVEQTIEELGRQLERARMEADAEFARELAELEVTRGS
ncbi:hypothetical protein GE09DRAFT_476908 [Coniochaeta sp. 2T2.1]|nr:hypothetical protein GE09DRAFT_476908 [Coniochaeta sp. 2T2.1]